MMTRDQARGLDKIAMHIVGETIINNVPNAHDGMFSGVVQYWSGQATTQAVFATIFSSIFIALFVSASNCLKLVSIPSFLIFVGFALRSWAFARCMKIASQVWK